MKKPLSIKNQGFTLSELLLVITLISILSLIAFPSFRATGQRFHAETVRRTLQHAIEETRLLAVTRRQKLILCGSENNKTCTSHWEKGWVRRTVSSRVLETWHFRRENDRLHYRLFPKGRFALVFLPSGWPEIENGTFWYCPEKWRSPAWGFVLNRSGRIRNLFADSDGYFRDAHGMLLVC